MATYYSNVDSLIIRTGIQPADIGFIPDPGGTGDAFGDFLIALLEEVTDLMDRVMRKSYLAVVPIPAGLNGIAADAASNALREMVATRQTPVVRIDDFAIRVIQSNILTPDIRERLKLYAEGGGVVSVDLQQDVFATEADLLEL